MQIHSPSLSIVLIELKSARSHNSVCRSQTLELLHCHCNISEFHCAFPTPAPDFLSEKSKCQASQEAISTASLRRCFSGLIKPVTDPCPSDCATTRSHQVSTLTCTTVQPAPWQLLERSENELEEVVKKSHWPCWIRDCKNGEISLSPSNQTFLAGEHE